MATETKEGRRWPRIWLMREPGKELPYGGWHLRNPDEDVLKPYDEAETYVPLSELEAEKRRHGEMVDQLAQCYRATGSEPAGVDSMDAMYALQAVKEMRAEHEALDDALSELLDQETIERLYLHADGLAKPQEQDAITVRISLEGAKSFCSDSSGWGAIGEQEVTEALLDGLIGAGHLPPYKPTEQEEITDAR